MKYVFLRDELASEIGYIPFDRKFDSTHSYRKKSKKKVLLEKFYALETLLAMIFTLYEGLLNDLSITYVYKLADPRSARLATHFSLLPYNLNKEKRNQCSHPEPNP